MKKQAEKDKLEESLKNSYCNFCQSQDIKITQIIKVECRNCGKTRLITTKVR